MTYPFRAILPVFNEEKRLQEVLNYYIPLLGSLDLIDNFSSDNTLKIANTCAGVKIYQKHNSGTNETTEWFHWLLEEIPSEYYLFLSCSASKRNGFLSSSFKEFHI